MKLTKSERQRRNDLAADAAIFGLSDEEQRELTDLHSRDDTWEEDLYPDLVSKIVIASSEDERLPDALQDRLLSSAKQHLAPRRDSVEGSLVATDVSRIATGQGMVTARESFAWYLATALCLLVAIVVLRQGVPLSENVVGRPEPVAPVEPVKPPGTILADARRELLTTDDAIELKWLPSKDPAALVASGGVVWSTARQEGFLTLNKLAANDPGQEQYQLWIIDAGRDTAQPVDGGVFNVEETDDEVIVRIAAKLEVFDPRAFAVTIEKPGGVVVSDRSRLPLLASVDAI